MDAILGSLNSAQIVAVISIVVGGIVALAMIVVIGKYQLQALADETTLKREKQEGSLALRTKMLETVKSGVSLESLLALDLNVVDSDTLDINAELAKRLGKLEVHPKEIERTVVAAMLLDASQKKAIVDVIDKLMESGADHEPILAAVRGLCARPASKEKESLVAEDALA